jgi:hypothetical protein
VGNRAAGRRNVPNFDGVVFFAASGEQNDGANSDEGEFGFHEFRIPSS